MVGDSLGLVLVIPVNKDARRAGEIDQIAFEIDVFRSGFFPFGHATSKKGAKPLDLKERSSRYLIMSERSYM